MPPLRSTLTTLPPAVHGARDYDELARLGLDPDAITDFSTNSNPYGPPEPVLEAVKQAVARPTLARYPDRAALTLCAAIAGAENVPVENILPGNGAAELIQLTALAFVLPGSRHLILEPTFGEYRRAIQLAGGSVCEWGPTPAGGDAHLGVEDVVAAVDHFRPDGLWLCNPNNPTGQQWTVDELRRMRAAGSTSVTLWVVDESYRYFATPAVSLLETEENPIVDDSFVILRSLTKEYALAGLRLGYAIAAAPVINALRTVQPPWSVNSLAQVAGVAALQADGLVWRQEMLQRVQDHAAGLRRDLKRAGFSVAPSATPYALVAVGNGAAFRRRLLQRRLLVRDCTSFGLPGHIRIAARRPADNWRLVAAMEGMRPDID